MDLRPRAKRPSPERKRPQSKQAGPEIPDLLGRWIGCYHMGFRMAKVRRVNRDGTLTITFQKTPGKKRISTRDVAGVWWRKRIVPLAEWTTMRTEGSVGPEAQG